MTRQQAQDLLNPSTEDGIYLVRESVTYPGDYILCVACWDRVEHYRIKYRHNKLTIDEEEFFENLTHLIQVVNGDWLFHVISLHACRLEFCTLDVNYLKVRSLICQSLNLYKSDGEM